MKWEKDNKLQLMFGLFLYALCLVSFSIPVVYRWLTKTKITGRDSIPMTPEERQQYRRANSNLKKLETMQFESMFLNREPSNESKDNASHSN